MPLSRSGGARGGPPRRRDVAPRAVGHRPAGTGGSRLQGWPAAWVRGLRRATRRAEATRGGGGTGVVRFIERRTNELPGCCSEPGPRVWTNGRFRNVGCALQPSSDKKASGGSRRPRAAETLRHTGKRSSDELAADVSHCTGKCRRSNVEISV